MKKYSTFHFSGYSWNHHAGKISLRYALDNELRFEEILQLPEPVSDERLKERHWQIERLLRALHIIGGISYYKTCLPKQIVFGEDEPLSKKDADFWESVYENGLGEFFYQNDIDFRGLIHFPKNKSAKSYKPKATSRPTEREEAPRILVPIGGGKDSIVTAELLKKSGHQLTLFRMNADPKIDALAHQLGLPLLNVRRSIDTTLFQLNSQGALNGHVPITAYVSILACLLAELYDFDMVAMSNEQSANIGNVQYLGKDINHQWSKSEEFEKMLSRFLKESVETDIKYVSVLRQMSELQIVRIFCDYPQYFPLATSCNQNWAITNEQGETSNEKRWCQKCPKCAFVFACMAAFLPKKTVERIFGGNMFEDETLLDLYRELLGIKNFKPFECVGTKEETIMAFLHIRMKKELAETPVMKMFETEVLPTIDDPDSLIIDKYPPPPNELIKE